MFRNSLLILFCFIQVCTLGQSAVTLLIHGKAIDAESNLPVSALRICINSGSQCVVTDADGLFTIGVSAFTDSLHFIGPGYDYWSMPLTGENFPIEYLIWQKSYSLTPAIVHGYLNPGPNASIPGSFGLIRREMLMSNDELSLQQSINTVPGVSMESRGYGGSQRIQIRGSFLRAPFAVRNVKMYMNGIPLSSPDGTAPLELVDAADVSNIEIVKGPAGSAWGSGTGGVILFRAMEAGKGTREFNHSQLYGAFGIRRFHTAYKFGGKKAGFRLAHVYQENDGYRRQEFNRKHQLTLTAWYAPSRAWRLFNYTTAYTGHWALPGSLDAVQVADDPTQAVAWSERNNSSVYRSRIFSGNSAVYKPNDHSALTIATYLSSTWKYNPYGTSPYFGGFKDEGAGGAGTRVTYSHDFWMANKWRLNAQTGTELQVESFYLREYRNAGGLSGAHVYSYETDYLDAMGFALADATWSNRIRLHAGLSGGETIHRITAIAANYTSSDSLASWGMRWLPRAGVAVRIDSTTWFNLSISKGISNPTIFEQTDPAVMYPGVGALVNRLNPERGTNYEAGIKGILFRTGIEFELTAYQFNLGSIILPFQDSIPSPSGSGELMEYTRYRNGGATRQRGLEAAIRKSFSIGRSKRYGGNLHTHIAYTLQDYRFEDYELNGNWSGNRLPGAGLQSVVVFAQYVSRSRRLWACVQYNWNDRMPLDNANTQWLASWHVLNSRIDIQPLRFKGGQCYLRELITGVENTHPGNLSFFFGINNALNSSYTSFPNLNDTRGRYYNPAPTRNFFVGLRLIVR